MVENIFQSNGASLGLIDYLSAQTASVLSRYVAILFKIA